MLSERERVCGWRRRQRATQPRAFLGDGTSLALCNHVHSVVPQTARAPPAYDIMIIRRRTSCGRGARDECCEITRHQFVQLATVCNVGSSKLMVERAERRRRKAFIVGMARLGKEAASMTSRSFSSMLNSRQKFVSTATMYT